MTINPSQAEGLGVCSPAQYESSELSFHPDGTKGCPSDSKIGTVSVKTPLLEETIPGDVYIAKPYDNPFDCLLAIYIVIEEPQRGILVKLPGEIRLNEATGRIESEFKDLPQLPFSTFDFHFREGARAPLITPPTCGTYETEAVFTPWSDSGHTRLSLLSSFEIGQRNRRRPMPARTEFPAFKPGFSAQARSTTTPAPTRPSTCASPRKDGEQDMTRFSADPAARRARQAGRESPNARRARSRPRQVKERPARRSQAPHARPTPRSARSLVGAGVGSVLTYVPGKVYLGGPFNGRPLSVIAITPVVAGPFDVGTVAVQRGTDPEPENRRSRSRRSGIGPDPPHPQGDPGKAAGPARLRRPATSSP